MKQSCITSFEIWTLIFNWRGSLRESLLTGLCNTGFMVRSHVVIEHLDFEAWKQYKDDRRTYGCEILAPVSPLMVALWMGP